jgi:membrane protein
MVALIVVAIQMLRTIESTFNDIWGVTRGRSLLTSVTQYFTVIALGPLMLALTIGITSGPHFSNTLQSLNAHPILGTVAVSVLPFLMLILAFSALYAFMPNTPVQFSAALMGGCVAGFLWQVNSLLNGLYLSRVVTYTKIYGGLGLIPLFLVGIYFMWLFLLFGAQVSYAYQNRRAYLQEKQAESVNQAGREFAALRIMTFVAQRFARGESAATKEEISESLGIPSRLIAAIVSQLAQAGLVVETAGDDPAFAPAKPLSQITCADILNVLRSANGQTLSTRDEPMRLVVWGELDRIRRAETAVAETVTLEKLAATRPTET